MEDLSDLIGDTPASKVQADADAKRLPPNAGKGRVKGVPNKLTTIVRDAIRDSLTPAALEVKRAKAYRDTFDRVLREQRAGQTTPEGAFDPARAEAQRQAQAAADAITEATPADYLHWLAVVEPRAYSTLLGKLLPTQLTGDEEGGPVKFAAIEWNVVPAKKGAAK